MRRWLLLTISRRAIILLPKPLVATTTRHNQTQNASPSRAFGVVLCRVFRQPITLSITMTLMSCFVEWRGCGILRPSTTPMKRTPPVCISTEVLPVAFAIRTMWLTILSHSLVHSHLSSVNRSGRNFAEHEAEGYKC